MTPYYQHGGGYVGASAIIAFLPEKNCGVVVLANAAAPGVALTTIVSIDVFDRVMEIDDDRDLLPVYEQRIEQIVADRERCVQAHESLLMLQVRIALTEPALRGVRAVAARRLSPTAPNPIRPFARWSTS